MGLPTPNLLVPIAVGWRWGESSQHVIDAMVEAAIVDVSPHDQRWTWILHRGAYPNNKEWRVSNLETGHYVSAELTKAEALADARRRLSAMTPEQIDAACEKAEKNRLRG